MKKLFKINLILIVLLSIFLTSCKEEKDLPSEIEPELQGPALSFEKLAFNNKKAYFSSDGNMNAPIDSNEAKTQIENIDITFFFDYDEFEAGFFDPVARSQEWNWNDFQNIWLSGAVETLYYSTELSKADFESARSEQSQISTHFLESTTIALVPHAIYPSGTCIGGRKSSDPSSILLKRGDVFGFKNIASGKRGLLYIRPDQEEAWPVPFFSSNTYVDIIREE